MDMIAGGALLAARGAKACCHDPLALPGKGKSVVRRMRHYSPYGRRVTPSARDVRTRRQPRSRRPGETVAPAHRGVLRRAAAALLERGCSTRDRGRLDCARESGGWERGRWCVYRHRRAGNHAAVLSALSPIAISSHLFWVTCRAAGIAALVLVSASVGVGVALSGRLVKGTAPDLRVAHEALSVAAFAMISLHVLTLLGDSFFHPSIADVAIPFERDYREPYMAIGIIGGWGTILLGLSYYVRDHIGIKRWKVLHRFTVLTWTLSVIHTLGEGSDSGESWFIAVVVVTVLPTALLILVRLANARRPPPRALESLARWLPRLHRSGV